MSKKYHFHDSSWLDVVADNVHRAYCRTCKKTFHVGNMGVAAVKSHMKSKTHASISGSAGSSTQAIRSFFVNPSHRLHPLILLLSLVTSSEQRYCGH